MTSVKALLFDLGGVVIDIDFNKVFMHWANSSNSIFEEIQSRFTFDHYYEAHERGEIESVEYFDSLRNTLGIDLSDIQFEEGWNAIFKGVIPGISGILKRTKEIRPTYAFTNSNPTHQKELSKKFSKILSHFNEVFNSSEIGKRKPEPEAFKIVADSIGVKLSQILFYDDSIKNIIGAKHIGMQTIHVKSILDIEKSLIQIYR